MLHAITCYFNPAGYRRRRANYRTFHERLPVPLTTVELSFGGRFELTEGDATHLIQVRGGDVMFQKERLLNLAIAALPADCTTVAWIDCDVILADGWAAKAEEALRASRLVHLYEEQYNLPAECSLDDLTPREELRFGTSVVKKLSTGEMTLADFSAAAAPVEQTAWGLAWAARRDLLEAHGLYDACILGSGDVAIFCAAVGGFERPREALRMNARRRRHYMDWARPFHAAVNGQVSWIPAPAYHLWHGDPGRRAYRERHQRMARFAFDPATDIRVDANGCWQWSSDKPAMHLFVADYFRSRAEDDASTHREIDR